MVFLMHLAYYTAPPAFSIHITGLFASVYLGVIKGEPLRGSRESHFSLLQESLRLAERSFPVGLGSSLREWHFRYNAVKHPRTAVTTTLLLGHVQGQCLSQLCFEYLTFQTSSLSVAQRSIKQSIIVSIVIIPFLYIND